MSSTAGELVVIEGIDGTGKTTVSEHLSERYGYSYMTQPEDSWVGEVAREALERDVDPMCDLFLHMAAHANQQEKLRSELKQSNVVLDRYYHSRVAYQSVQTELSANEIEDLHLDWTVSPSKVIILDAAPQTALARKNRSKDKFENREFLSEVRSVYRDHFKNQGEVVYVDAEEPKDTVLNTIESHLH